MSLLSSGFVSTDERAADADRRDRDLLLLEQARLVERLQMLQIDEAVGVRRSRTRSLPYASTADW